MTKLEKINSSKIAFWTILFIQFCILIIFNYFTPWLADDYSFYKNTTLPEIFTGFKNFYLTWGGRLIGFFFTNFYLILSKTFFNIFCSLSYVFVIYLIYDLICGKKSINNSLLLIISILMWFFIPAWGQDVLWICGHAMYFTPCLLILLFVRPYTKDDKNHSAAFFILTFLLGIFSTWSMENFAVGTVVFTILHIIKNKFINKIKSRNWEISGLLGTLVGSALLLLAPGNYARLSVFQDSTPFIIKLASRFFNITLTTIETLNILLPIFVLLIVYLIINKSYSKLIDSGIFFISFLAVFYSMIMSPTFPARAMILGIIFFIISMLKLYNEIEKTEKIKSLEYSAVLASAILLTTVSLYRSARNIYHVNYEWKKRITYIEEQKKQGITDIEVPVINSSNYHTGAYDLIDLSENPDTFPNVDIANYFDLTSIKGY